MVKSKRTNSDKKYIYCRKCQETKDETRFYKATDSLIDSNGFMSVCKTCCTDIYNAFFLEEKDISRTILRVCRILNIRYDTDAVDSTIQQVATYSEKGAVSDNIFGMYKSKLISVQKTRIGERGNTSDYTFEEPSVLPPSVKLEGDEKEIESLEQFWGIGFDYEDYSFLEKELSEWKKTSKCDTKAEESLLKEICHKQLDIRKKRLSGGVTGNLVKELQDLMKTAAVDPSKVSASQTGKSFDTFSNFIKVIEQNEPADYYKDKKLFADYDNIGFYFEKYVTRPLRNFVTLSRDFNVSDDDNEEDAVDNMLDEIK